jgi:hypothetical protein
MSFFPYPQFPSAKARLESPWLFGIPSLQPAFCVISIYSTVHCNENPIYVFPEKELRGLSPNFHIHVSVRDLYIPMIGPHIFPAAK